MAADVTDIYIYTVRIYTVPCTVAEIGFCTASGRKPIVWQRHTRSNRILMNEWFGRAQLVERSIGQLLWHIAMATFS